MSAFGVKQTSRGPVTMSAYEAQAALAASAQQAQQPFTHLRVLFLGAEFSPPTTISYVRYVRVGGAAGRRSGHCRGRRVHRLDLFRAAGDSEPPHFLCDELANCPARRRHGGVRWRISRGRLSRYAGGATSARSLTATSSDPVLNISIAPRARTSLPVGHISNSGHLRRTNNSIF